MTVATRPSDLSLWLMAIRPRTLSLSVVPVAVGSAIAWCADGRLNWLAAPLALIAAAAIQICCNLYNDVADHERGGDGPDRLGPVRVTSAGWLTPAQVKRGVMAFTAVAALAGVMLVTIGGWPILMLGVLSLLAGWGYTGGPLPIAYTPFGELFVLLFFGLGAVAGTTWLHTLRLSTPAMLAGSATGLFAAAVLLVNNHRDAVADARVGRRTLAILAGPRGTPWLYGLFMLAPFALLPLLDDRLPHAHAWLAWGALPPAVVMIRRFVGQPRGPAFNFILGQTALVQLVYGVLLCLGLVV